MGEDHLAERAAFEESLKQPVELGLKGEVILPSAVVRHLQGERSASERVQVTYGVDRASWREADSSLLETGRTLNIQFQPIALLVAVENAQATAAEINEIGEKSRELVACYIRIKFLESKLTEAQAYLRMNGMRDLFSATGSSTLDIGEQDKRDRLKSFLAEQGIDINKMTEAKSKYANQYNELLAALKILKVTYISDTTPGGFNLIVRKA